MMMLTTISLKRLFPALPTLVNFFMQATLITTQSFRPQCANEQPLKQETNKKPSAYWIIIAAASDCRWVGALLLKVYLGAAQIMQSETTSARAFFPCFSLKEIGHLCNVQQLDTAPLYRSVRCACIHLQVYSPVPAAAGKIRLCNWSPLAARASASNIVCSLVCIRKQTPG